MPDSRKYIVVSLPRTGTLSLCEMGKICRLKSRHISQHPLPDLKAYDLFADTPYYCLTTLKRILRLKHDYRFIYLERDFAALYRSWNTSNLIHYYHRILQTPDDALWINAQLDKRCYGEAFGNVALSDDNYAKIFQDHKDHVINFIQARRKPLLIYRFEDGWSPFCEFIDRPVPNLPLPHLHANNSFAWAKNQIANPPPTCYQQKTK